MIPLTLGGLVSMPAGGIDQFSISLTPGTTYVMELTGVVMLGIWPGDPQKRGGEERICGVAGITVWGRYKADAATSHVIQVSSQTPPGDLDFLPTQASYTLLVRPWTIWDNFQFNPFYNPHKSAC